MWKPAASPQSSDGRMIRFSEGNPVFTSGAFYILDGAAGTVSPSTETSIFVGDTSTSTPIVVFAANPPLNNPGSTRYLGGATAQTGSMLTLGTNFNFNFYGLATFGSTPNLTVRFGLNGGSSFGTFNVLATTGAIATSNATTQFANIFGGMNVVKTGTSGSIAAHVGCTYGVAGVPTSIVSPVTVTTIDTTQPYQLDILATISGGSSTLAMYYGAFEVIG